MSGKYEGPDGFEIWLRDYNKKLYKLGINPIEVDDEVEVRASQDLKKTSEQPSHS